MKTGVGFGVGVFRVGVVDLLSEKMLFGVEEIGAEFLLELGGELLGGVGGWGLGLPRGGGVMLFADFEGLLKFREKTLPTFFEFDFGGVSGAVEDVVGESLFHGEGVEHTVFDCIFGDEVDDMDGFLLSFSPGSGDALFELCRIPGEVAVDDDGGILEIKSRTSGFGAEDDFTVRVLFEGLDFESAFLLRNFAGVPSVSDFLVDEVFANEGEHSDPFGKDDDFGFGILKGVVDDFFEFVEFG